MTTEEKFLAAVKVIQALPKKGPFQPSVDLQLKFYALFKQATEGPNTSPKPYMWEVIKKFKWDAWNRLGKMSKDEAMETYLRELNYIVESMASNTENIEESLVGMDDFYAKVPAEYVDLCIGPTIEKIRSKAGRSLPSYAVKSSTQQNEHIDPDNIVESKSNEEVDDIFVDSMDTLEDFTLPESLNNNIVFANGNSYKSYPNGESTVDIITRTIITLRKELNDIDERMKKLELREKSLLRGRKQLFGNLSPQTIAFITLWPIFVNLGIIYLYQKNKKQL